jgi:hypothetical protein
MRGKASVPGGGLFLIVARRQGAGKGNSDGIRRKFIVRMKKAGGGNGDAFGSLPKVLQDGKMPLASGGKVGYNFYCK